MKQYQEKTKRYLVASCILLILQMLNLYLINSNVFFKLIASKPEPLGLLEADESQTMSSCEVARLTTVRVLAKDSDESLGSGILIGKQES